MMVRHGAGGRQAGPAAHQQDAGHDRREAMTNFGAHERYLQGLAEMLDREGPPDQAAVAQGTSLQPGQKPRADSRVALPRPRVPAAVNRQRPSTAASWQWPGPCSSPPL